MKRITAFVLATVLVLAMAGCSKKAEETAEQTTAAPITEAATEASKAVEETQPAAETAAQAVVQVPQEPSIQLHPIASDYYECAQRADNTMEYVAEASYLSLSEEDAAAYPNIVTALQEDYNEYIYQTMGEFIQQWKESTAGQNIELGGETPFKSTVYITRMDSNVASLLVNTYVFLGGAHGSTVLKSFNYKTNDMAWLQLSEVVKDNEKLQQILAERLVKEYPDTQFFDLQKDIKKYVLDQPAEGDNIPYVWTMDYDSVQIFFPEEALASHADGSQMIDLKFAEYPDLFTNTYGAAPENYITYTEAYVNYTFGEDTVEYEPRLDQNGIIAELAFNINGKETVFNVFCNDVKTWFVTEGQNKFFYVFTKGDDDEDLFYVYRIAGGNVTEESKVEARIASKYEQTDPIGTAYGYSSYASQQTHEIPADPAGLTIDVKENGNRVEKTVSIENGTVVIK